MKSQILRRTIVFFILGIAVACHRRSKGSGEVLPERNAIATINSASALVSAMRARYSDKWYTSLSFTQVNRYTIAGKEQKSEWLENLSVPAKLRIDFLPLSQKSGLLIDNSRVMTFVNGKRIDTRKLFQPRPLLLSDIYVLPANITMRRLDSLGIDTTKLRLARDNGKRFFILGAENGDLKSTQAWFDAETLLLARFIQTEDRAGKKVTTDMRVTGYKEIAGFPVPEAFTTSREGVLTLREEYTDVRVNAPVAPALFDPAKFATVKVSQ